MASVCKVWSKFGLSLQSFIGAIVPGNCPDEMQTMTKQRINCDKTVQTWPIGVANVKQIANKQQTNAKLFQTQPKPVSSRCRHTSMAASTFWLPVLQEAHSEGGLVVGVLRLGLDGRLHAGLRHLRRRGPAAADGVTVVTVGPVRDRVRLLGPVQNRLRLVPSFSVT